MNKQIIGIILLLFSITEFMFAQSQTGIPYSAQREIPAEIETIKLAKPDVRKFLQQDSETDKDGGYYRIGRSIETNVNMLEKGSWETLPNGDKVCRLQFSAPGALALGVYYNNFWLPEGGRLFLYDEKKHHVIGAFTNKNNPESGFFATELISGDVVTLEYNVEAGATQDAIINISELAYVYRGYDETNYKVVFGFGDSESCEVNINCSEGNNWQDQKRGVARILLKEGSQYGWCTGSLVNNVRQDFEPYFLTADHCGQYSSTSDYNQWIFYFNFEATACSNPTTAPGYNTITGCTKISNGGNAGASGSDFKLLLFSSNVPVSFNVYFNGWNSINQGSSSGVCIHHPAGDIKKISTYTSSLTTAGWNGSGYNSHWRVYWSSTSNGHGVTEGGSSGSPLFNSSGNIAGTLTGGSSYCTATYMPDYYGKFSYSWQNNGTSAQSHLKEWLDPDTTGATVLSGINQIVAITGLNTDYCLNDSAVSLTGIPSGGTFFGTGMNGNVFDPGLAGVGTYYIYYSTSLGSASLQLTVHQNPNLDLGSDLSFVNGQIATVSAISGFASYLWSTGSTTQSISTDTTGTYFLTVSNTDGCTAVDDIYIDFASLPLPSWTYVNTGNNHTILVQDTTSISINGIPIEIGDYIGVFYDSLGILACAGYMPWLGTNSAITAWGSQSGNNDGFATGEEFKWKIWDASAQCEYLSEAEYITSAFPNTGFYNVNGMSALLSLSSSSVDSQLVGLVQGWSIISTYIEAFELSTDSIFAPVINEIIILKNGDGDVFWPPYLNMIGDLQVEQGYQVYMSSLQTLPVYGFAVIPQNIQIPLSQNWSIISYLRVSPGNVAQMLSSLGNLVIIVKNGNGMVYWPPFINDIGNMLPGQGYQIKLSSPGTLVYPAN
ncbi:MAG: hypothetical protein U9R19_07790 [Bacteroidota bacterium]|nr:hypothetical protein [Bacteroidota bacterium]